MDKTRDCCGLRTCIAWGNVGYFHRWTLRDGEIYGIVEFSQSTRLVSPESITFSDETNAMLNAMNRAWREYNNDKNRKD